MTKNVALKKCEEYNFDQVYKAIAALLELVPPPDVSGKTVLLKPNILSPKKPETAATTHPVVVGAAVKAFVELGAKEVLVGESPGVVSGVGAAKTIGMYEQVVDNGGQWVDFTGGVTVPVPNGKILQNIEFAEAFTRADVVVSLAKLKTHQFMSYTGAMKNLFGFVVGLKKSQMHYRFQSKLDFARYLTDLNLAAAAHYAIMDAITGMEGMGGPGNGDPVHLGFLAASDNILALDWICSKAVGYNPHEVANLEDALSRGVWLSDPDDITTVGDPFESVECKSFKIVHDPSSTAKFQKMIPGWLNGLAKLVFVKTPRFNAAKCIRCGKCIEICPAKTIHFSAYKDGAEGEKPHVGAAPEARVEFIDRKKCLHCFCCHEICPVEAIKLHRF